MWQSESDVFVILWRGEADFDKARGSVRAMLLGIARHLVWKRWRQDRRWSSLDEETSVASDLDEESLGVQEAVPAGIAALPPLQREALILATYEELSLREIGHAFGVEVGTVKARLRRARENFKGMLAMYGKAKYGTAE